MADRSTTRTIRARAGGDDPLPLWDDGPDGHPGRRASSAADHSEVDHSAADHSAVLIDCDTCAVRGQGCGDCVVTVLLGMPAPPMRIGAGQVAALGVLAGSGLVPPLRHDRVC